MDAIIFTSIIEIFLQAIIQDFLDHNVVYANLRESRT
jgi:hypothetical protein